MKTTIELPDELLIALKKKAVKTRTTLRVILERAARRELEQPESGPRPKRRKIRWVVTDGGVPPGLDVSNREKMWDRIERERDRY